MQRLHATSPATTVLAIIACGAAFTWLGPVLRPFLVAVFVFYAIQSAAKALTRLGLGLTAASISLLCLAALSAVLFAQLAYRESVVFLRKWPKYERRIEALLDQIPLLEDRQPGRESVMERDGPRPPTVGREGDTRPPVAPAEDAATASVETGERTVAAAEFGESGGPAAPKNGEDPVLSGDTAHPAPQPSLLREFVRSGAKSAVDYVFRHGLDAAELLLLVLVYAIFLAGGRRQLPARIMRAFPGDRGQRLLAIGAGIGESMEKFMTVKTAVGTGMAVSSAVLMAGFGIDHWLLWAIVFFMANYVTYIGSMAACVPPIMIALLDLKSPALAGFAAVLLVVNRLVWVDFVEVRLAGRELSLDPVLVFLWLTYWGWVWGVTGLLLAYPMLAAVKIVLSRVEGWEGWAVLLGDK